MQNDKTTTRDNITIRTYDEAILSGDPKHVQHANRIKLQPSEDSLLLALRTKSQSIFDEVVANPKIKEQITFDWFLNLVEIKVYAGSVLNEIGKMENGPDQYKIKGYAQENVNYLLERFDLSNLRFKEFNDFEKLKELNRFIKKFKKFDDLDSTDKIERIMDHSQGLIEKLLRCNNFKLSNLFFKCPVINNSLIKSNNRMDRIKAIAKLVKNSSLTESDDPLDRIKKLIKIDPYILQIAIPQDEELKQIIETQGLKKHLEENIRTQDLETKEIRDIEETNTTLAVNHNLRPSNEYPNTVLKAIGISLYKYYKRRLPEYLTWLNLTHLNELIIIELGKMYITSLRGEKVYCNEIFASELARLDEQAKLLNQQPHNQCKSTTYTTNFSKTQSALAIKSLETKYKRNKKKYGIKMPTLFTPLKTEKYTAEQYLELKAILTVLSGAYSKLKTTEVSLNNSEESRLGIKADSPLIISIKEIIDKLNQIDAEINTPSSP